LLRGTTLLPGEWIWPDSLGRDNERFPSPVTGFHRGHLPLINRLARRVQPWFCGAPQRLPDSHWVSPTHWRMV